MPTILPKSGSRTEPPPAEALELADIVMQIQRKFLVNLSRELARGNVSFAQFFLLGALQQGDALTMSKIAEIMGHTTAAATGLVDRLEKMLYVERAHATTDRRKIHVRITPKGKALVTGIKQDMVKNLSAIMTHLTAAERKAWVQIYRKIDRLCMDPNSNNEAA